MTSQNTEENDQSKLDHHISPHQACTRRARGEVSDDDEGDDDDANSVGAGAAA